MVMTASAPVTASAGDEAAAAPWSINGAVLLLVRFQTVTSWPASSSRVAIGLPISPRPRKASLLIECSVLGVTCLANPVKPRATTTTTPRHLRHPRAGRRYGRTSGGDQA